MARPSASSSGVGGWADLPVPKTASGESPANCGQDPGQEQDGDGARYDAAGDLRQLLLRSLVGTYGVIGVSEANGRKDAYQRAQPPSCLLGADN
jgi:hypothetical protein